MEKGKEGRLSADTWIEAGFLALMQGGVEALRVETLAKSLNVTKGSFYWHFKDRRHLFDEMLKWWEREATQQIIDRVEAMGGAPDVRLRNLIELGTAGEGDQLEGAIRSWGAIDEAAKIFIQRVDQKRERYVTDMLRELGLPKETAAKRARILYLALIGEFTWTSAGGTPSGKAVWQEIYGMIVQPS
jgi:AcrR family transcriptional regulator